MSNNKCYQTIPYCKKQEENICVECNYLYSIENNGLVCDVTPLECNTGMQWDDQTDKCTAIPIDNCKTQESIICNECEDNYTLVNNNC